MTMAWYLSTVTALPVKEEKFLFISLQVSLVLELILTPDPTLTCPESLFTTALYCCLVTGSLSIVLLIIKNKSKEYEDSLVDKVYKHGILNSDLKHACQSPGRQCTHEP